MQLAGVENKVLVGYLASFDDDLCEVFKSYLNCVRDRTREEVETEGMGAEWTERVIQSLTSEWKTAKRFAVNVISGESETVHRFCVIAADLMCKMVNDYLPEKENLMEECRSSFENASADMAAELDDSPLRRRASQIFIACRHFKSLICQMKDRSLRTLGFARMLLLDVENCAFYKFRDTNMCAVIYQLLISQHSMVVTSGNTSNICDNYVVFCDKIASEDVDFVVTSGNTSNICDNYVVFCDKIASEDVDFVRILLNITCSRIQSNSGYMLIVPLRALFSGFSQEMWSGSRLFIELDPDTELSLRYLQFAGDVCVVASNGKSLPKARELFVRNMTLGNYRTVEVLEDQSSCHEIVNDCTKRLKESASQTCQMLFNNFAGKMIEDVLDGRELCSLDHNELESVRATLIQAYNLAFEYHREFCRILSRSDQCLFARQTVGWTKQWLEFILQFASPGDGSIPLWATTSFQFLTLATDPLFCGKLTATEYQMLAKSVDACVAHFIGSNAPDSGLVNGCFFDNKMNDDACFANLSKTRPHSTTDGIARSQRIQMLLREIDDTRNKRLEADNKIGRVKDGGRNALSLSTPFSTTDGIARSQRIQMLLREIDDTRNKHLEADNKIGRVKDGSGKFGTVYVVMNLTDNCLMAMKQIRIQRNDKALLALVDEVENLRALDHPNLVKYYAVEEELLIFMEYCSEGTLEEVCREGLLDLRCVRRYTHFLLKGVEYIHRNMIIHRDIKPANIFLGKKDVLKLGDFGSSVRLRGATTACGEVAEWVGSPAYMAPEVQTLGGRTETNGKAEMVGYGRAADIWSVGCVVLEMCTGKPPWHECEHVLQIVFRVGCGMKPTVPQSVQTDETCVSFLDLCFRSEPSKRASAQQLCQHPFANINVSNLFLFTTR
ncbi:unnamed protein product [Gongylonema pulchrum]|uniref:Protein kinase domain-containing protein n=1 Tax=Gongylonema pulchrum TaxID=637853 RepID=A0A183DPJ8_9BILA|nr:unnamed protein product [Gongylonema pulchrum]